MSLVVPISQIFNFQDAVIRNNPDWKVVNLSEVATVLNGFAFPSSSFSQSNGVPLIRIRNIATSSTDLYYAGEYDDKYIINKDDLLIGMDGNFECHRWKGLRGLLNQRVCKIIPDTNLIEEDFFLHQLNNSLSRIQRATSSVTVGHLSSRDIANIPVLLPPFAIQKKLNSILKEATKLIQNQQIVLTKLKRDLSVFRQSVLSAAVTGKLTEGWRVKNHRVFDWQELMLKNLVEKRGIFDGPFGSHLKTSDYTTEGVRVIRLENIGPLQFIESKKTFVSEQKFNELSRHSVNEGDIIFASFIADGVRTVVLPKLETKAIAKADCFCIRVNKKLLSNEYLCYALSSYEVSRTLTLHIHGATRPRINTTQLKEVVLPVPSIEEQCEIVARIQSIFQQADLVLEHIQSIENQVDKLTQSILAKAFRGEL